MPSRAPETAAGPGTDLARTGALNLRWAERFVAALLDAGVREACVCSGSRSAPLALALGRSRARTHIPLDERAGAFFALGLAKAARRPVAVLTTSGTAAANLFPAIVEAYHARVPLVVLTADRPPELRDTGAAQTIDQIKLYAGHVRWFCEVGTPSDEHDLLSYVASLGTRGAAEALGPPAGPVHVNFAFREPLIPFPDDLEPAPPSAAAEPAVEPEAAPPSPRSVERVARALRSRRKGLIVCGPDDASAELARAVARLAEVTGYPILADPASQARYGAHDRSRVLGAYDGFLRAPGFAGRHAPEAVLHFGAAPTSKACHVYLARHAHALHLGIDAGGEWRSPTRRVREVLAADPAAFALALARVLEGAADPLPAWLEAFRRAERESRQAIARHLESAGDLTEGGVFADLLPLVPEGGAFYVGNSMAIRDLDAYVPDSATPVRVLANRGASGIDGLVSSALGASAASAGPVLAVMGDLSFHHDLTGLEAARRAGVGATIVVVHNDGGGIFSFLPIADHGGMFERYFATPHGLDFSRAAALYDLPFARVSSREELRERTAASLRRRATEIIEVRTDRDDNRARHRRLWDAIVAAVDGGAS